MYSRIPKVGIGSRLGLGLSLRLAIDCHILDVFSRFAPFPLFSLIFFSFLHGVIPVHLPVSTRKVRRFFEEIFPKLYRI